MDHIKKTVEDLKTYYKAMNRMKELGICSEWKAIIYLQREIDQCRDKIKALEKLVDELRDPVFVPCQELQSDNLVDLPEDMRDRVYMMDVNKDGSVTLYFAEGDDE